jgi:hypothetical protein
MITFLRSVLADLEKHAGCEGASIANRHTGAARKEPQPRTPRTTINRATRRERPANSGSVARYPRASLGAPRRTFESDSGRMNVVTGRLKGLTRGAERVAEFVAEPIETVIKSETHPRGSVWG